ncbi:MAG: PAS domain S-box protein [candidate division Zixibacteria bacterium]|nr:PAS domain S-box protein [candidate division Zixibacteria bacterium]
MTEYDTKVLVKTEIHATEREPASPPNEAEFQRVLDALRESELRLYYIVEGNAIATFVIDANHIVTHWNKACEELTGFAAADMVGTDQHWRAFYRIETPLIADLVVDRLPVDRWGEISKGEYRKSAELGDVYEQESFFSHFGKRGKWLFFAAKPLINGRGEIIGAVETLQDVTERKLALQELQRHRDHLEQLVHERTIQLEIANHHLQAELNERRQAEEHLRTAHRELTAQQALLGKKNMALKEMFEQIEQQKVVTDQRIKSNVNTIIMPLVQNLKRISGQTEREYVLLLENALTEIVSPFISRLEGHFTTLTPREMEICNMIKSGMTSKDVAAVLGISEKTIAKQRRIIRKKLRLTNRKVNLAASLRSI